MITLLKIVFNEIKFRYAFLNYFLNGKTVLNRIKLELSGVSEKCNIALPIN
jgi:hypothetical protein